MSERQKPVDIRLGVPEMDREHGVQVRLLAAIRDAFARSEREQALELIDELYDYTNRHFLMEETLMIRLAYPGRLSHGQEHVHLREELWSLRSAVAAGEVERVSEADAIEEWLLQHIRTFDRAFASYIAEKDGDSDTGTAPAAD